MSPALPILLDGLSFRAGGRTILDRVSLRIEEPGITALIGPNGAGKSVLLRLLDGLLPLSAGAVRIGPGGAPARRAFVFQRPGLVRASAGHNIRLALAAAGWRRAEARARCRAALALVGLADRARDPATRLSGGEQQRLALARAWAVAPDLLLLDEPTANLDPAAAERVEQVVAGMAREGVKVLLVSHHLGQVARLARDVVVLSGGRVAEHGPVSQVLTHPRAPETRAYLAGELPWTAFAACSA
ncbi:ABC transporter related [Methylobacterium sp. 4-46]|uniref:ATP-binding cassette domain-containing protein n=1 Tax=unclassified Methylobacterium TaxID=2615210 RepID=UPI000152E984|nr:MULTISPECIES: ATP-binding cassette domain-containing protein [Methylobacterium]ACA18309.1 ABC transporter related [Methylobacterium sp. 4-46]WFT77608.1 ATP-binding cassette domain-containing protein [Methylobacterium nodulans]